METGLSRSRPGSDPSQLASEALELALKEMENRFASESPAGESESALAGRRDGVPPPGYAERVRASRQQARLPIFDAPSRPRTGPDPTEPVAAKAIPAPTTTQAPPVAPAESPATIPLPLIASGEKTKARDILAAIRTLKAIEQERRRATPEERQILRRFGGFGAVALSLFPDPVTGRYKDATWQALADELKDAALARGIRLRQTDHLQRLLHLADRHREHPPGALPASASRRTPRFWSPAAARGNFLARRPRGCDSSASSWIPSPAGSPRPSTPSHDIRIENFRDTRLPEGRIDAVIGNVPFADVKLDYRGQKLSLHDYFFAKSTDALKPGGVLALVTTITPSTSRTPRCANTSAAQADFVGAIRLPSDAFKREGTAVVTDIVFLRKRAPGDLPNHADPEWLGVAPLAIEGAEVPINRYFLHHPEMVLGTWSRKDTLYGGETATASSERRPGRAAPGRRSAACRNSRPCRHPPPGSAPAPPFTPRRRCRTSPKGASSSATTRHLPIDRRPGRPRHLRRHRCSRPTAR